MARITSGDVARASGVSRTTVSYVLNSNGDKAISAATRERVKAAALELGYAPSAAARTLRSGRSDLVLCVLPDWPVGPLIDSLLEDLSAALADRGLALLTHHGRGRSSLADLWRAVTPRAVIGFTPFQPEDERAMRLAGIEVLSTMLDVDPHRPGAFTASQTGVGRLQAQHLAAAGHRSLGYARTRDPRLADFAERRLAGVRLECTDLGLPLPLVVDVDLDVASAASAVRAWRGHSPPVTAVAAYNDEVALAVLAGLRSEGLAAPGDVAVIGVDDIPSARLAAPPLTTVSQAADVQARYLAALVLSAFDGDDGDGRAPPRPPDVLDVVVRAST